jgi:hypothetical protein
MESTNGQMGECTKEIGRTTRCMEWVYSTGMMEGGMKESTLKIRNKDMECSSGQMGDNMMEVG